MQGLGFRASGLCTSAARPPGRPVATQKQLRYLAMIPGFLRVVTWSLI